ncbi:MAG: hypothetical protein AAF383_18015 [Cyanobacteria bacterium P01_A01_bin.83]
MCIVSSVLPSQSALIPNYVQKWERIVNLKDKTKQKDRASIEASVQSLYTALGKPAPQIHFFTNCKEINALQHQGSIAPLLDWLGEPIYLSLRTAEFIHQLSQKMEDDVFTYLTKNLTNRKYVDIKKGIEEILIQAYELQFAEEYYPIDRAIEIEPNVILNAQQPYVQWMFTLKRPEIDCLTNRVIIDKSFFNNICSEFNLKLRSFLNQLPSLGKHMQEQIYAAQAEMIRYLLQSNDNELAKQKSQGLQDCLDIFSLDSSTIPQQYGEEFWSVEIYRIWLTAAAFTNWNIGLLSALHTGYTYTTPFAFLDYCMNVLFSESDLRPNILSKDRQLVSALLDIAESGAVIFTFERVCLVLY